MNNNLPYSSGLITSLLEFWANVPALAQCLIAVFLPVVGLGLYLARNVHYRRLLDETRRRIPLAPIRVKRGIAQEVGVQTVGLLLKDQFAQVKQSLMEASTNQESSSLYSHVVIRSGEAPDSSA